MLNLNFFLFYQQEKFCYLEKKKKIKNYINIKNNK